jgi:hypothetical protein
VTQLGIHFLLDHMHQPYAVEVEEWTKKFNEEMARVAYTVVNDVEVSTIFLGIATAHENAPMFETMVFGGTLDMYQVRYHTWAEAQDGHNKMVRAVEESNAQSSMSDVQPLLPPQADRDVD